MSRSRSKCRTDILNVTTVAPGGRVKFLHKSHLFQNNRKKYSKLKRKKIHTNCLPLHIEPMELTAQAKNDKLDQELF